jgi:hypothetical protein
LARHTGRFPQLVTARWSAFAPPPRASRYGAGFGEIALFRRLGGTVRIVILDNLKERR